MTSGNVSRRCAIGAAAALALSATLGGGPAARASGLPVVAILGDSITAGYGLPAREALPARLQGELARLGEPARVVAQGVVGDTTAGGLARVDRAAQGAQVCVVALGGNDLLRGIDPGRVRANLDAIVRRLKARHVTVVLAGLQVPPILQGRYATAFDDAFASVARAEKVLFVPDMLAGVTLNPDLNQPDGIHPNARGVEVIARRLAPVVARSLPAR
jgi:acyl-CoA thioesterase-1